MFNEMIEEISILKPFFLRVVRAVPIFVGVHEGGGSDNPTKFDCGLILKILRAVRAVFVELPEERICDNRTKILSLFFFEII